MKTINLMVPIESEKLAALQQYAAKKDVSVTAELSDAADKLYEKLVPAAVREYIDARADTKPTRPNRVNPPRPSGSE